MDRRTEEDSEQVMREDDQYDYVSHSPQVGVYYVLPVKLVLTIVVRLAL